MAHSKCRNCHGGGDGAPCGCQRPDYAAWGRSDLIGMVARAERAIAREREKHLERIEGLQGRLNHFHALLSKKEA